jgi:hypothetical protein
MYSVKARVPLEKNRRPEDHLFTLDEVCSRSLIVMNRFVREVIMISPPNFRNSFGILSKPTALPDFNETRAR